MRGRWWLVTCSVKQIRKKIFENSEDKNSSVCRVPGWDTWRSTSQTSGGGWSCSHYLVITVPTISVGNNNFPPQEKFQLPLEFENNKVNHDLRFFFNEPVWCSWTGLNFPSEESNNSDPSIVGASFVYWSDMTLIKVHCENWKEASTKEESTQLVSEWLNIPAQVGVTITDCSWRHLSSSLTHAPSKDKKPELESWQTGGDHLTIWPSWTAPSSRHCWGTCGVRWRDRLGWTGLSI